MGLSHIFNERDPYLPTEKNHGYVHRTSYDLWTRDMDSNKTSGKEVGSGPSKHGEDPRKTQKGMERQHRGSW